MRLGKGGQGNDNNNKKGSNRDNKNDGKNLKKQSKKLKRQIKALKRKVKSRNDDRDGESAAESEEKKDAGDSFGSRRTQRS